MKILLAVDGSDYTKKMLRYVAAHEGVFGPRHEYTALCVVPPIPQHAQSYLDLRMVDGYYVDEAEAVLVPVRRFFAKLGWPLQTLHHVGDAGQLIAAQAEAADMVVMGSHGRSAVANLALGSVTTQVLARCRTPLLVVR